MKKLLVVCTVCLSLQGCATPNYRLINNMSVYVSTAVMIIAMGLAGLAVVNRALED